MKYEYVNPKLINWLAYSELHKQIYGFRPDEQAWEDLPFSKIDDMIASMTKALKRAA